MYDYFLDGKINFAADRQAADAVLEVVPTTRTTARENRAFVGRAVRYLVTEAGVSQFLDIGTGRPTEDNVHDVAQALEPSALVLAHARALLTSSPEGRTAYAALAFSGLELVPPGEELVSEWRPDREPPHPAPSEVNCYGGVARKP